MITGCSAQAAKAAHDEAGHDVKLAVLLIDGLSLAEAWQCLDAAGGNLREARAIEPEPINET
jgi:N-acetylmuramic acid 6-phosphate (MurNAc-6-P) etherase